MDYRDKQAIDNEAVEWLIILRDEDATDDDRRRFDEWRLSSIANETAFRETERMWDALDLLADTPVATNSPSQARKALPRGHVGWAPAPSRQGLARKAFPAALCLVLAVAAAWQLVPRGVLADHRSGVGERQTVRLDDGSVIELGTGSAIEVDFSPERRSVKLLTGEAFFEVAKDTSRPFEVLAEGGRVEVRGTAFNVRIDEGVTIAVTEHTVDVSAAGQSARVTEGEMVRYDRQHISRIEQADLDTVGAWRQDQLIFKDTPLNQVIAELQRYHRGHIQLLSGGAGKLKVTAVFDARRPDAALETIAKSLDLQIYRATSLLVGIVQN